MGAVAEGREKSKEQPGHEVHYSLSDHQLDTDHHFDCQSQALIVRTSWYFAVACAEHQLIVYIEFFAFAECLIPRVVPCCTYSLGNLKLDVSFHFIGMRLACNELSCQVVPS